MMSRISKTSIQEKNAQKSDGVLTQIPIAGPLSGGLPFNPSYTVNVLMVHSATSKNLLSLGAN
jgi:hypothetical protein